MNKIYIHVLNNVMMTSAKYQISFQDKAFKQQAKEVFKEALNLLDSSGDNWKFEKEKVQ